MHAFTAYTRKMDFQTCVSSVFIPSQCGEEGFGLWGFMWPGNLKLKKILMQFPAGSETFFPFGPTVLMFGSKTQETLTLEVFLWSRMFKLNATTLILIQGH